ncbi:MAG: hypothetical protein Q4A25_01200 [Candidatus Saccharibacteria bacterium]|nr:hypothetical protein [Candidatus Saccharibacteria bacterium]
MRKMSLMSLVILAVFTVTCYVVIVAGLVSTSSSVAETSTEYTGYSHSHTTTSIFGLWCFPELDPYTSTDYYLFDDLTPGSIGSKNLPFKIYTQTHIYELDRYKPEMTEYGYAWLNLKELDKDGNILWESPFKYNPNEFAKLRYDAFLQTVRFVN